ncbi:MAG: hypothetical protein K0R88_2190 [Solirubrobacterales bacterium]|nr:hypothetical protein [Solirubrobacterales bacterium]
MRAWHMLVCAGLVVAGVALAATGASAVALVPVAACALMMGAMVWMMMRGGGGH